MTRQEYITLVRREQEGLRRFLLALCLGRQSDADDIAQETFIRAYMALDRYEERASAAIYLRRIAYNSYLNYRKSQTRHHVIDLVDAPPVVDTSTAADSSYRYQDLYQALSFLSDAERTSIIMHYIEGYKISEISKVTQQSTDAIKKQLQRGRQQLKKLLTPS